jgi:hypothetical protein
MSILIRSAIVAASLIVIASPSWAKTDCNKDIAEFDAAVMNTTASKTTVAKATKLRDEARKDCDAGGSKSGDADMRQALKLIHAK